MVGAVVETALVCGVWVVAYRLNVWAAVVNDQVRGAAMSTPAALRARTDAV